MFLVFILIISILFSKVDTINAVSKDEQNIRNYSDSEEQIIDSEAPTISDVKVTNTAGKYTITAKVTDDYGIDRVDFFTWTASNWQDGLVSEKGIVNGDTVTYTVDFKNHNYETGEYLTHVYVYDKAGKSYAIDIGKQTVNNEAPTISNVKISDITSQGYTVSCNVSDDYGIDRMDFLTWNLNNAKDDIVLNQELVVNGIVSFRVAIGDYGYDYGYIYAYDKAGKPTGVAIPSPISLVPSNTNPGWKIENGRKYLFDTNGKWVQRSRYFVIDVSKWQGNINWNQLARESSVDAVILRVGHGTEMDTKVQQYVKELNRLSIPYGFYHYNTAITIDEARQQALSAVNYINEIGGRPSLPVYADIEEGGNDRNQISIARTYCQIFEQYGYRGGVYANLNYWKNYLKYDPSLNVYAKWIANYGTNNGLPSSFRPDNSYCMWQYTSRGSIPGISGNVDLNVMFE